MAVTRTVTDNKLFGLARAVRCDADVEAGERLKQLLATVPDEIAGFAKRCALMREAISDLKMDERADALAAADEAITNVR